MHSQLFPQNTKPKLSNKNYKSRSQLHPLRTVNVKKDTKDVRFKHLSGENENNSDPKPNPNMKI